MPAYLPWWCGRCSPMITCIIYCDSAFIHILYRILYFKENNFKRWYRFQRIWRCCKAPYNPILYHRVFLFPAKQITCLSEHPCLLLSQRGRRGMLHSTGTSQRLPPLQESKNLFFFVTSIAIASLLYCLMTVKCYLITRNTTYNESIWNTLFRMQCSVEEICRPATRM